MLKGNEIYIWKEIYAQRFIAALVIVAKIWKQVSVHRMNDKENVFFRYPEFLESLFYAILLLWKTYISTCFQHSKKKERKTQEFLLLQKGVKMKIVLIICFAVNLSRVAAPPWRSTLGISLAAQG